MTLSFDLLLLTLFPLNQSAILSRHTAKKSILNISTSAKSQRRKGKIKGDNSRMKDEVEKRQQNNNVGFSLVLRLFSLSSLLRELLA